jgi:Protein of unknown function (DUF3515)
MTTDPRRRSAARIATFVAVPIALAVLLISALMYGGFGTEEPPAPGPAATGPVTVTAAALPPEFVPVCQQIVANLPDTAAGQARRPVTDGPEQNAAYGDPPIIFACGTVQPTFPATDEVFTLSGVCWHAMPGTASTAWTTVDRVVPVTVTVPGTSDGSAQSVVPFSEAVGTNDPRLATVPSGCS